MNWKKYLLTKLFITIGFFGAFSTPQIPDKLIYKGDTLRVYINLPDEFWETETIMFDSVEYVNRYISAVKLFGDKKVCEITSCYVYYAAWEIIENQLYLTDIYSCCYYEDSIKADLTSLFKEKVIDGKVKADWVSGNLISDKGKRLIYYHVGNGGVFEYQLELHFKKGNLIGTQLYDNRKSKQSVYSQNHKKLQEHIYSNTNWNILPQKQDSIIRVFIEFSANEEGIIDDVKILRGYNEVYDQEAVRVLKTIPEWDVYLNKGKFMRMSWYMSIFFSEENRKEYEK